MWPFRDTAFFQVITYTPPQSACMKVTTIPSHNVLARHRIFSGRIASMANKALVLTMPARRSFSIRVRHKIWVAVSALFCRSGRWHGRTMQALSSFK
jgi:hypothetical protein